MVPAPYLSKDSTLLVLSGFSHKAEGNLRDSSLILLSRGSRQCKRPSPTSPLSFPEWYRNSSTSPCEEKNKKKHDTPLISQRACKISPARDSTLKSRDSFQSWGNCHSASIFGWTLQVLLHQGKQVVGPSLFARRRITLLLLSISTEKCLLPAVIAPFQKGMGLRYQDIMPPRAAGGAPWMAH